MANENEIDTDDETEDFIESLGIAHHLAILDLIDVIGSMNGAPTERLNEIRAALVELLPPEDIETLE